MLSGNILAVSIENAHHSDFCAMHALAIKIRCFGYVFAFVISTSDTNRVYATSIALWLGVDRWVSVDLNSAC